MNSQPKQQRQRYANKTNKVNQVAKQLASVALNGAAPKSSRRNRNRRRPNKKNKTLAPANTIAAVERNLLNKGGRMMSASHPYVKCRLNPFGASGGDGIPDGGNSNYIVVDSCVVNTITDSAASGFIIQTLGLVPIGACLTALGIAGTPSTITVDGKALFTGSIAGQDPANLYPLAIPPQYDRTGSAPGKFKDDPYNSTGVRIIAVQHKLTYTGPPLNAQGTYVVTPNTFTFANKGVCGTGTDPTTPKGQWFSSNGSGTFTVADNTQILAVDGAINPVAYVKDSKICRIDRSLIITPRHKSTNFPICPTNPQLPFITADNTTGTAVTLDNLFTGQGPAIDNIAVYAYDNDWQHFQIVVNGYAPGSTFTLETAYCWEYTLSNVSPFTPMSKKASPVNKAALDIAQKAVNMLPTGGSH
jgi:hypothetical protein